MSHCLAQSEALLDGTLQGNGGSEGDPACTVRCWGCGLQLQLPSYSPIFKCGYCGAVSRNEEVAPIPKKQHPARCPQFFKMRDRITVGLLCLFIGLLIGEPPLIKTSGIGHPYTWRIAWQTLG